ncbi:hypothetical protein BJ6T_10180 [Bradyrhizobium japonicum USDA 6]|nr:hypothetical protein BJ6T_10180 [Bradyrhizobium japonicum USDA 6]
MLFASPRAQGEAGMRALRGFRVRGTLRESNCHPLAETPPHPKPSPRKRGEGAHLHRG